MRTRAHAAYPQKRLQLVVTQSDSSGIAERPPTTLRFQSFSSDSQGVEVLGHKLICVIFVKSSEEAYRRMGINRKTSAKLLQSCAACDAAMRDAVRLQYWLQRAGFAFFVQIGPPFSSAACCLSLRRLCLSSCHTSDTRRAMAEPSRGVEFRQAVDVLLREQRAFEDERAQWEYERVELLNKYADVNSSCSKACHCQCLPRSRLFALRKFFNRTRSLDLIYLFVCLIFAESRALNARSKRKKRSSSISQNA
jgi:hypothetical protein